MVASHLVISEEMVIFVTDVSPFCDDLCDIMELNSIYDDCCWSWMEPHFRHNLPSIMGANDTVNDICVV
jgi:hypothetical protein